MTSSERVVKTLKRETPDRIPLDLGGTESSGLTAIAYRKLRQHLGLSQRLPRVFDTTQQLALIDDELLDRFEIDVVPLHLEPASWKPGELSDGSPCEVPARWSPVREANGDLVVRNDAGETVARMPADGFYFEPAFAPLASVSDASELDAHAEEIASFDWPFYADESLDDYAARARQLADSGRAVCAVFGMHFLAAGQILRGYENAMVDLVVNKPLVHALMERLLEAYCERCDRLLAHVGDCVQAVELCDDLGTQQGPMLSLDAYREMIWPYQKRLVSHIKRRTDAAVLLHSCGSVYRFIPHIIEAGFDALNPVQVSAAEMDTARLKREFGRDITFWGGGCDTQHVLPHGTPDEIDAEVSRRIRDLSPGGGFIYTQVHNIQPDVPAENIVAMLDAFRMHQP